MTCPRCHRDDADSCKLAPVIIDGDEYAPVAATTDCEECGVTRGGFHHTGCSLEKCPACGEQRISCDCEDSWKDSALDNSALEDFLQWLAGWQGQLKFAEETLGDRTVRYLRVSIRRGPKTWSDRADLPENGRIEDALDGIRLRLEKWMG